MSLALETTDNYQRPPHIKSGWSFTIPTPDGKLYVFIYEKNDSHNRPLKGQVEFIQAFLGKNGNAADAWLNASIELINGLLREGRSVTDIIISLSGITTAKSARMSGGILARSGPEGLMIALLQYKNSVKEILPNERRRGKFTARTRRR